MMKKAGCGKGKRRLPGLQNRVTRVTSQSLQEQVNKDFEKKALDFKNESLEPLARYREDAENNGWEAPPFVVQTTFAVPFNQDA